MVPQIRRRPFAIAVLSAKDPLKIEQLIKLDTKGRLPSYKDTIKENIEDKKIFINEEQPALTTKTDEKECEDFFDVFYSSDDIEYEI